MIRLLNLTLQRGPQRLLEAAELTLHAGQKAGLIGANGAGKSSLFALLRGQLGQDAGDCLLPADWRIAHMRQEVDTLDRLAVDYVLDGDSRLREIQAALAVAEAAHDGSALARLHTELDNADGYTADARARKLLAGLGFSSEQMERRVGDFSGGWRMRLNLAQALMCPSDLLLLDEPTNHLDLDAILWLEEWLKGYPGTLVLISHDRDFLDAVVDHVVHLENRKRPSTAAAIPLSSGPAPSGWLSNSRPTRNSRRSVRTWKASSPASRPRPPRRARRRAGSRRWSV